LSRNFGHQKAILAGLEAGYQRYGSEVFYALMDADNEDKPEDLRILYDSLCHLHCSCVFAVRKSRQVSWFDSLSSKAYHALFRYLSTDIEIPSSGAFCIMAPKVVQEILKFRVCQPYFPGMRAWVGFRQQPVELHRGKRGFGASRVRLKGRIWLAFNSFLNHSNLALDLIQWGGLTIFGISVAASLILAFLRIFDIIKISGFTSVLISIFMSTGLILMALGIMTHYLARIYYTISAYPRVVVDEIVKIEKTGNNATGSS
jgi:dolichol-phosphate mannosyltransferase